VEEELTEYFPGIVSYNRFVQLKPRMYMHLVLFALTCRLAKQTGTYHVESAKFVVCHNLRIYMHKVFDGLAKRGKSSNG